jgi:hypothetical protein
MSSPIVLKVLASRADCYKEIDTPRKDSTVYRSEKAFVGVLLLALALTVTALAVPQVRNPATKAAIRYGLLPPTSQGERKIAGDTSPLDAGGGKSIHEAVRGGQRIAKGVPGQRVYTTTGSGDANGPWPGSSSPTKSATVTATENAAVYTATDSSFAAATKAETQAAQAIMDTDAKNQKMLCNGPCAGYTVTLNAKTAAAAQKAAIDNASSTVATPSDPTATDATSADSVDSSSVSAGEG